MPGSTSRLGLGYPVSADLESAFPAVALANATILDAAILYSSGLLSARPAAGTAGRIYRATDVLTAGPNGTVYFDNGTSWQPVGSAFYSEGLVAARPAAGLAGRFYRATDVTTPGTANGAVYFDNGTSWYQVGTDVETAFSVYKTFRRAGGVAGAPGAGTYGLPVSEAGVSNVQAVPFPANTLSFYFDPADWTAGTRATKFRVRAYVVTNAVAPATTWTAGLYPVATWGGASGAEATVATLGTVTSGSTVAFATPASGGPTAVATSGDFTAPSAGHFVLAFANSGSAAAGSAITLKAELQYRQV